MIVKGDVASKYKPALVVRFASKDRELDDQLLWTVNKPHILKLWRNAFKMCGFYDFPPINYKWEMELTKVDHQVLDPC